MKILVVHNFHRNGSASGDDQVFKNETKLLEDHGNTVLKFSVSNDDYDNANIFNKIRYALGMIWSFKYYNEIKKIINEYHPDVMHVHTFSPLLSPSILYSAKKCDIPVVATLHDTRFVCPCATSLRNNKICNKCGDGRYFRMIKYKCYKNSRVQSLIMAFIHTYHNKRKSFYNQIDRYICLNDIQIDLLKKNDYEEKKIVKKYNFMEDIYSIENNQDTEEIDIQLPEKYVVFYGRISEEKGIRVLMKVWDKIKDIPLVVMGVGSLDDEFKKWADNKKNVYFLGYTKHEKCLSIVKKCEFVLFPSIWYEGCSMVMIETQCIGKAIVATDIGFSSEAITEGFDGLKVKLGDINGFVKKIRYLWENHNICVKMGENARNEFEKKYTPLHSYNKLMEIYKEVIED